MVVRKRKKRTIERYKKRYKERKKETRKAKTIRKK